MIRENMIDQIGQKGNSYVVLNQINIIGQIVAVVLRVFNQKMKSGLVQKKKPLPQDMSDVEFVGGNHYVFWRVQLETCIRFVQCKAEDSQSNRNPNHESRTQTQSPKYTLEAVTWLWKQTPQIGHFNNTEPPPVLAIPGAANGTIQLGLIVHLHGHKCHEP